jgi:O-antigen ligase
MNAITDRATAAPEPRQLLWTPTFILLLVYTFIILTNRIPGATFVMGAALLSLLVQRQVLRAPAFLWLLAAWLVWAVLGYTTTLYPDRVWDSLLEHGKILLVVLVAVNALRTPAQIRVFLVFLLASYILFPIRSTLTNYLLGYTLFGRAVGPFIYQNPNDLAAHTILMLGPAVALLTSQARKGLLRWLALTAVVLLVITILLTQSRGGFLGLLGLALPAGIGLARRRPRLVPLGAALVGVALLFAPAGLWERLGGLTKAANVETIRDMDPEGSAEQRFAVLQTAARIVSDHPLLGVGLGAYGLANADYSPALGLRDTHNTYMNVAAETGLPGLALFLALIINVLMGARAARRNGAHAASPAQREIVRWLQWAVIGYLIAGVFGSYARLSTPYIFLALLWSASRAASFQRLVVVPRDNEPAPHPIGPGHAIASGA